MVTLRDRGCEWKIRVCGEFILFVPRLLKDSLTLVSETLPKPYAGGQGRMFRYSIRMPMERANHGDSFPSSKHTE